MIQLAKTVTFVFPWWGGPQLPPHREAAGARAPASPLFEAACWPRSGVRGVTAFPTFVGSEKEDAQWWRGAWL